MTQYRTLGGLVPPASSSWRWTDNTLRPIYEQELFSTAAVVSVYIGSVGRSQRYVGAKTDAELYVGAGSLFG